jgi:hypothetical protein
LGAVYFKKDSAIGFIKATNSVFEKQTKPLAAADINKVQIEMAHTLAASGNNFQSVNLSNFISLYHDSLYQIKIDTAESNALVNKIMSVQDTGTFKFENMGVFVEKNFNPRLFAKYHLDQFVTTHSFWNNIQTVTRDLSMFFTLLILITACLVYYDARHQHASYTRNMHYHETLKTSKDVNESWANAQRKLESYYQHNLEQNNWTFRLSVIVMCIGFIIIYYGISRAINLNSKAIASGVKSVNDGSSLIAIISTASGLIVNLIGGTFLSIYNSTLKQAIDYTTSLQKTSTVGTSLAILKSIETDMEGKLDPETTTKLIDAKIAIAKQLIGITTNG